MRSINIADAKARLSELVELAAAGERVVITKRGKPVLELTKPQRPRRAIHATDLRAFTERQPRQKRAAADTVRKMRTSARY